VKSQPSELNIPLGVSLPELNSRDLCLKSISRWNVLPAIRAQKRSLQKTFQE